MTPTIESPWHADVGEPPVKPQLREELAELERQAIAKRAEVQAKLAVVQGQENQWRTILAAGLEAWTRLKNVREHLQILRQRHAAAAVEFDKLVGGEAYTLQWHADQSISPLLDSWAYGQITREENPFCYFGRVLAALELAIGRVEKRLPEFERAEADARRTAQDYAKANGIEHQFTGEPKAEPAVATPTPGDPGDSDPASAIADEPPEPFPGKRKATR